MQDVATGRCAFHGHAAGGVVRDRGNTTSPRGSQSTSTRQFFCLTAAAEEAAEMINAVLVSIARANKKAIYTTLSFSFKAAFKKVCSTGDDMTF